MRIKSLLGILTRIMLVILPVVLLAGVFVTHDPYDYWGIYDDMRGYTEYTPLPRCRTLINNGGNAIILGDSRSDKLDPAQISQLTGYQVVNLAVGGQTLNESIDLFWFATETVALETVYFQVSFYNMSAVQMHDRYKEPIAMAQNPLQYMVYAEAQKAAVQDFWEEAFPPMPAEVAATPYLYDPDKVLLDYANNIRKRCEIYDLSSFYLEELAKIGQYCLDNGIDLIFYTPPLHTTIWDYAIGPTGILPELDVYKQSLSMYAELRDMEYVTELSSISHCFADGFHFRGEVLDNYIQAVFTGEQVNMRVWRNGQMVTEQFEAIG